MSGPADAHSVTAKVKTLINAQLKAVLKLEGLPVSGVKATLQERIIAQVHKYARGGDLEGFNRVKDLVNDPDAALSPAAPHTVQSTTITPASTNSNNHYNMVNGAGRPAATFGLAPPLPQPYHTGPTPIFKDSPFYTIVEPLTPVLDCKVRESTRDQVECKVPLRADIVNRLQKESNVKAMVYCASDPITSFSKVDIAFPHQVEIRVNQEEFKGNLRGLKNKPGSTRPADITGFLRPKADFGNILTVTYALTQKKYYLVVNLVRVHSVEELVLKLKSGKTISKEQVIREMINKAEDGDIVATSSVLSLKCPLSTLRIDVPCRSTICSHNQCFDASSFLQLQEQAPTWTCPVCNKVISFGALEVDQYVDDILKSTPPAVDQVLIEPHGKWSHVSQAVASPGIDGTRSSSDDDDLIEIRDVPRLSAVKSEATQVAPSMARTPPYSSREQSSNPAASRSGSGKRSIGQVIDLTFSDDDDDDDAPPRAPKRQVVQHPSSGLSTFHTGYGSGLGNEAARLNGVNFTMPPTKTPARTPDPSIYPPRSYGYPP
ncbi:Zinc finger, RING/FYVE/PHD-type [Lasallia pustulata]|uniref:Zinc finger, RING/FYVE/PHD-type n=1 Tax=Lasallia pustulata TaxID=136370 RepID=A0A1W5CY04_9LECA|nr:Zinc finger, RING/FYVE/PHD-type [Lasallia pustulata]